MRFVPGFRDSGTGCSIRANNEFPRLGIGAQRAASSIFSICSGETASVVKRRMLRRLCISSRKPSICAMFSSCADSVLAYFTGIGILTLSP